MPLRFIAHHQSARALDARAPTSTCAPPMSKERSANYADVEVERRTRNEGGRARTGGKREAASASNSGVQAPILASECQLWQETERRIIVSSRV